MSVQLRGGQGGVSQQLLYSVKVGATVEHIGGEGMSQDVRAALSAMRYGVQSFVYYAVE